MTYFVNLTIGVKLRGNSVRSVLNETVDIQNLSPRKCNYLNRNFPVKARLNTNKELLRTDDLQFVVALIFII